MVQITIDADVCKKDGLCAMACMRGILAQDEKGTIPTVVKADLQHCYGCGQCVAICNHGAISHSSYPEGTVTPVVSEQVPDYDQVLELMRSRRSKRLFRDRAVKREDIEKVLDAARFAPSGHNEQTTEFVVVQNETVIRQIGVLTANNLAKEAKQYQNPIAKTMMRFMIGEQKTAYLTELAPELGGLADLYEEGTDWILRDAPVLVLFCAHREGEFFSRVNANLALHNAALAAETLGLGCFYTGFVVLAADRDEGIARLVSLPETHKIYGSIALGHAKLTFNNWPERNPAKVTWV